MDLAAKLHDIPKPAWIVLMVAGFIWWWPLGLAILAYLAWSRRMSCWNHGHWRDERNRMRERAENWWRGGRAHTSGNRAFDEYREDTLRRLEDEQREFRGFLDRLRHAKDKEQFDQFMDDRRRGPAPPPPPRDEPPPAGEPAR